MKKSMMKRHSVSLLLALAICFLSLIPIPETPLDDVRFVDKWVHLLMYGTLSLSLWLEMWRANHPQGLGCQLLLALVCPAVWGGLMELAQACLTTCRSGDWLDFWANSAGAALVSLVVLLVRCVRQKKG